MSEQIDCWGQINFDISSIRPYFVQYVNESIWRAWWLWMCKLAGSLRIYYRVTKKETKLTGIYFWVSQNWYIYFFLLVAPHLSKYVCDVFCVCMCVMCFVCVCVCDVCVMCVYVMCVYVYVMCVYVMCVYVCVCDVCVMCVYVMCV